MFGKLASSLQTRNPFYLLSAASMLVGCFALSRSLDLEPGNWKPLAVLIGVLQVYEIVLIALGVFLLRRRTQVGDARTLFILEAVFLLDATFLNAELASAQPWAAPWVATVGFALAAVKLLVLREVLGLTSRRRLVAALVQIGVLLYAPAAFSSAAFVDTKVFPLGLGREWLPLTAFVSWWLVGLLPLLHAWALDDASEGAGPVARAVEGVLLVAPFLSGLVHVVSLQWMYDVPMHAGFLAPLALGLGAAVARYGERRSPSSGWHALRFASPVLALVLSLGEPPALVFELFERAASPVDVTPLRIAFFAVGFVCLFHRFHMEDRAFVWLALLSFSASLSGGSLGAIRRSWMRLVPETGIELGLAAVIAAFAFLALGLALSLWRPGEARERARPRYGN